MSYSNKHTHLLVGTKIGVLFLEGGGGMTSGLVGEMTFQVLPTVPPLATVVLCLATMLVSRRNTRGLVPSLT